MRFGRLRPDTLAVVPGVTTRSRVGRNALVGATVQIVSMGLSLLTTPVQLQALGMVSYGALAVVGSLMAYVGILDLGIGGSLTRYMSFYEQRGEQRHVDAIGTFGVVFYLGFAALLIPILLLCAPAIGRFLTLPPDLQAQFPLLLAEYFGLYIASSLTGILSARLASLHRMDLASWCGMTGWITFAALMVFLLPRHPTLQFIVLCSAIQIGLSAILMGTSIWRITGRVPLAPAWLPGKDIRQMFSFGAWTQVASVTAVVNLEADKAVISHNLSVGDVTPYQVANRLAMLNRSLPLQLIISMLPHVTARVSSGLSEEELTRLYADSSRLLMLATLVISGFVAAACGPALRFWLGADIKGAAPLAAALIASYAVNNATGIGTTVIKAYGRPQLETYYGIVSAVLNVGFTILLIRPLGLYGVVAGTILGNVIGSVFFLVLFHRSTKISWWRSMGDWLSRLLAMTLLGAGAAWAVLHLLVTPGDTHRLTLFGPLVAGGLTYCAVFAVTGMALRFWQADDLRLLAPFRRFLPARRARS